MQCVAPAMLSMRIEQIRMPAEESQNVFEMEMII
jgi:hypothetical protein